MASNTKAPASTQKILPLDSQHQESINDCQYDYYGTQVASCDNNGIIQISLSSGEL